LAPVNVKEAEERAAEKPKKKCNQNVSKAIFRKVKNIGTGLRIDELLAQILIEVSDAYAKTFRGFAPDC
jgi:hypothetical protein